MSMERIKELEQLLLKQEDKLNSIEIRKQGLKQVRIANQREWEQTLSSYERVIERKQQSTKNTSIGRFVEDRLYVEGIQNKVQRVNKQIEQIFVDKTQVGSSISHIVQNTKNISAAIRADNVMKLQRDQEKLLQEISVIQNDLMKLKYYTK